MELSDGYSCHATSDKCDRDRMDPAQPTPARMAPVQPTHARRVKPEAPPRDVDTHPPTHLRVQT